MKLRSKTFLPFAFSAAVVLAGCIKMPKGNGPGGPDGPDGPDGPEFPPPRRSTFIRSAMNPGM